MRSTQKNGRRTVNTWPALVIPWWNSLRPSQHNLLGMSNQAEFYPVLGEIPRYGRT